MARIVTKNASTSRGKRDLFTLIILWEAEPRTLLRREPMTNLKRRIGGATTFQVSRAARRPKADLSRRPHATG
jgi:hypothetical protein